MEIGPDFEVCADKMWPPQDLSVTCMDGLDKVSRVPVQAESRQGKHPEMVAFVERAHNLGQPLNIGKEVVAAYNSVIFGGELDGVGG